jgi:hypothetical protein
LRNGRARSPLRAADAVNVAFSRGAHGVTRPTGKGRFMERLDGKAVLTHEDHEPSRNGRARSPLRAADAVNVAFSRGAHGVTRPTGNGRFMERPDVQRHTRWDHEPGRAVWCPGFSLLEQTDTLKGGHRTHRFMESAEVIV